jgi:autotransporter-associated beta strand protein
VGPFLRRWQQAFAKLYPSGRKSRNRKRLLRPRRVALEPLESRVLLAIDLTTLQHQIVDVQDPAYTETGGNWQSWSDPNAYQGSFRYHAGGDGSDGAAANWDFAALDPTATYQVFVSWTAASNRASNSPFTVLDGTTPLATVTVNQEFAPANATGGGTTWESLGTYRASTGTLNVELGDAANGYVIANAACVAEVPPVTSAPSVIGNGDAAYAETGSGWLGWSEAGAYGGDFRYHAPGDGSDTATWTFQDLVPGRLYQAYATWSPGSNRADNAPFTVSDGTTPLATVRLNQQIAPSDATIDGQGWESLGVYTATSGTLSVQLSDAGADGDVIANAIRLVDVTPPPPPPAPSVVDTADPAYAESGSGWLGWSDTAAYGGQFRYHTPGDGSDAATWTFAGVDPTAQYQVYATWSAGSNRADNAPFTVSDGTTPLATTLLNQQIVPSDATIDGQGWESLGVYTAASGTLTVNLGDNADGDVIADAIRIVKVSPVTTPPSLVKDGDAAYAESGSGWLGWSDTAAYGGQFRYHTPGDGADAATWTFADVDPGAQYQVYTTWSPGSNRADNAPYTILDGATALGTVQVNQQNAPSGATTPDGQQWTSLGTYTIASGTLTVQLADNADGDVIANAVRIVELPAIESLTASPSSVVAGQPFTLTANVQDSQSAIQSVAFYCQSADGTRQLLPGTVSQDGSDWSVTVDTTGMAPGTRTFCAQATAVNGGTSAIASTSVDLAVPQVLDWDPAGADLSGYSTWDTTSPVWWSATDGRMEAWQQGDIACFQGSPGTVSIPAGTQVIAAGIQFDAGYTVEGAGQLSVPTGGTTIDVEAASATIAAALSGSGGLTKIGAGTLILAAQESYSGATSIEGGTLKLGFTGVDGFGGDGDGWTANGRASVTGDVLTLTDGGSYEARSAFYDTPLPVDQPFQVTFTYQASGGNPADGAAFVLENDPAGASALGGDGGGLGYAGITPSAAVAFNIYGHVRGTQYYTDGQGHDNGGAEYASTSPVNLASGDPIQVALSYDGANLVETLTDQTTGATFTTTYADVNLAAQVGGDTAYLGFTGGSGGLGATQSVSGFVFSAGSNNILPTGTAVRIAGGAALDLSGSSQTIASFSGAGSVALGSGNLTIGGDNTSTTFSGVISGSGDLTKTGSGTLTLAGASTFTGTTTVSAGTLQLGDGVANDGSLAGDIVDNAAVVVADPGDMTLPGVTSGSGSLTKTGAGTLTLANPPGQAGATTVDQGTLALGYAVDTGARTIVLNGGTLATRSGQVTAAGDLVDRWTFFGTADDSVGSSNATLGSGVGLSSTGGKFGTGAIYLPGGDQSSVSMGALPAMASGTQPRTISAWVCETAQPSNWGANYFGFYNTAGSPAHNTSFYFDYNNGTVLTSYYNDSSPVLGWGAGQDSWHLLTATWDGTSDAPQIYVDGVLTPSSGGNGMSGGQQIADIFGIDVGRSGFTGYEDDLRVYDAALTASQVAAIYNNGAGDGGGIDAPNTTVQVNASSTLDIEGSCTLGNVSVGGASTLSLTGGTPTVGTVTMGSGATLALGSGGISAAAFADAAGGAAGAVVTNAGSSPATITLAPPSGTSSFSGSILDGSGGISLAVNGAGTQVLAGADTFSGPTTVSGGTLTLANQDALQNSTLAAASGSVLFDQAVAGHAFTLGGLSGSGDLALQDNAATPDAVALTVGGDGQSTTYSGDLSGPGSLTKAGSGTLTVSAPQSYGGATSIDGGTLQLDSFSAINGFGGDGDGWTTNGGASVSGDVLTVTDGGGLEARSAFYDTPLPVDAPFQATFTYQVSGSGNPADGAAFVLENDPAGASALGGDGGSLGYAGITPSAAVEFNVYSGHTRGTGYYTDGQTGGNGGSDYMPTGSVNLASGDPIQVHLAYDGTNLVETLTDQTTGATFTTTYAGVDLAAQVGGDTAYLGFTGGTGGLASTQTINFLDFAFSTGGSVLPASTAVQIAGGATLDLNGVSQTIGSLADAGGSGTASVLLGSGALTVGGDDSSTTFSGMISGSGSVTKTGTGTLTLDGANSYTGQTTVSGGTLQVGNAAALENSTVSVGVDGGLAFSAGLGSAALGGLAGSGNLSLQDAADSPLALTVGGNGASTTYSGVLSGPGSLAKTGSGTLVLTGANSYGTTTISTGMLQVGDGGTAGTLGTGAVTDDGALVFSRSDTLTVTNAIGGSGSLTQSGVGTLVLTGANSYGTTTIAAGTLQVGDGGTAGTLGAGAVTDGGALVFSRSDTLTVANAVGGSGSLTQSGTGTLVLAGANGYTGVTTVSAGTLQLGDGLANDSSVVGNIVDNAALVVADPGDVTLSGTISGSGSLSSEGGGILTLTGANTFAGGTQVVAGTVALAGASPLGTGGVTLAGGTLAFASIPGFSASYYNVSNDGYVPDFSGLTPVATRVDQTIDFPDDSNGFEPGVSGLNATDSGAVWTGLLNVTAGGSYTFQTTSDDGSLLYVDGTQVVNDNGPHGMHATSGSIDLTPGSHLVTIEYAQAGGGAGIVAQYSGPDTGSAMVDLGSLAGTVTAGSTLDVPNALSVTADSSIQLPTSGGTASLASLAIGGRTLAVLGSGTLAVSGGVTLAGPGSATFDVPSGATLSLDGVVSGATGLTKTGAGSMVLAAANTYSGTTSIVGGTLQALAPVGAGGTDSLPGDVSLNNATLRLSPSFGAGTAGFFASYYNVTNTGYVPDFSGLTPVATRVDQTIDFPDDPSGFEPGVSGLSTTNSGAVWTGLLSVTTGGSYTFQTDSDDGSLLYVDGTQVVNDDGPHGMQAASGSIDLTPGSHLVTIEYAQAGGGAGIIAQYSGPDTGNTMVDVGSLSGTVTNVGSSLAAAIMTLSNDFLLSGTANIDLDLNAVSSGTLTAADGSQWTLTTDPAAKYGVQQAVFTQTGAVTLAGSLTLDTATADVSISGPIGESTAGAGSLVASGPCALTLSGDNTYGGGTTLAAGTVNFAALENLGSGPITFDGGTLQYAAGNTADISSRTVTFDADGAIIDTGLNSVTFANPLGNGGSGGLTKTGTGTLTLLGDETYAGDTLISAGTLQLGDGVTQDGSLSGNIVDNGTLVFANPAAQAFAGSISGTGSLTKTAAGTLSLSGENTFAGATTVTGGTIEVAGPDALAGSTVTVGSASDLSFAAGLGSALLGGLAGTGDLTLADAVGNPVALFVGANGTSTVYGGALSGPGSLVKTGGGTLTLATDNAYTGGTTIAAGTLQLGDGTAQSGSVAGNILDDATLVFANPGAQTFAGVISGSGGVTKQSAGTLVLSGQNTYAGLTDIGGGTLQLGADNALPAAAVVQVGDANLGTGVLDLNAHDLALAGLYTDPASSPISLDVDRVINTGATAAKLTVNNASDYIFGGVLAGDLSVDKYGPGTWTLAGDNSNSGDVAVYDGTLDVTGGLSCKVYTVPGAGNPELSGNTDPYYWIVSTGMEMGDHTYSYTPEPDLHVLAQYDPSQGGQPVSCEGDWTEAIKTAVSGAIYVNDTQTAYTFGGSSTSGAFLVGTVQDLAAQVNGGGPDKFLLDEPSYMAEYGLTADTKLIVMEDEYGKSWCDSDYNDVFWVVQTQELPMVSINPVTTVTNGTIGTAVQAQFTVTLSQTTTQNVIVGYSLHNGDSNPGAGYDTAALGQDYSYPSGQHTVTILAGQPSATFDVPIINADVAEPTEKYCVSLDSATNAIPDPSHNQSTGWILNNLGWVINSTGNALAADPAANPWTGTDLSTSTNPDIPECTLPSMLQYLNDHNGGTATFNILPQFQGGNGVCTIIVDGSLPQITTPIFVAGATQATYENSNATGPLVDVAGGGFTIVGGPSTVDDVAITGAGGAGAQISDPTGGDTVSNCYIGVKPDGITAGGNGGCGVDVEGSPDYTIQDNVISNNGSDGIRVAQGSASGPPISTSYPISGNTIGTDAGGTQAMGNGGYGIQINGVACPNIANNTISANAAGGIYITGSNSTPNTLQANNIGVNKSGLAGSGLGNGGWGIEINAAPDHLLSGAPGYVIKDNTVSANASGGIYVTGSNSAGNSITGNWIGLDASGAAAGNTGWGIKIENSPNYEVTSNVVSKNTSGGVYITGANTTGTTLTNNFIGTDPNGTVAMGNGGDGVRIDGGANSNVIGGSGSGAGNVISGNTGNGVTIDGGTEDGNTVQENVVQGNFIGTNKNSSLTIGNTGNGVAILAWARSNHIGGSQTGAGNVISRNGGNGVLIDGGETTLNTVQGNYIGTSSGGVPLGNTLDGVLIQNGATANLIGSDGTAQESNVIGANTLNGVHITASSRNVVAGNYIGTNSTYSTCLNNGGDGVLLDGGAQSNRIGVNNAFGTISQNQQNTIDCNSGNGVHLSGPNTTSNTVAGNFIGTEPSGDSRGNSCDGVLIESGASSNLIGSDGVGSSDILALKANVIAANTNGVHITGASTGNVVAGNYIGTNSAFATQLGNTRDGVLLDAGPSSNWVGVNSQFGTPCDAQRNFIDCNGWNGVRLGGSAGSPSTSQNTVAGNYIGTNAASAGSLGNTSDGVSVQSGANYNWIGINSTAAEPLDLQRNFIDCNKWAGVRITGPAAGSGAVPIQNNVEGNYIGTDAAGDGLGNMAGGVIIKNGAMSNRIGVNGHDAPDVAADEGNVISGNQGVNVEIDGARSGRDDPRPGTSFNIVAGNAIGTTPGGLVVVPGAGSGTSGGVLITQAAQWNLIGTDSDGVGDALEGNVISACSGYGVQISGDGSDNNTVAGNKIGTDATGSVAMRDQVVGVAISLGAQNNLVGVNSSSVWPPSGANVISGNSGDGVQISGEDTTLNVVAGNEIGTNAAGSTMLGNQGNGVLITGGAGSNTIGSNCDGDGDVWEANTIWCNGGAGVFVQSGSGNSICENSIFANTGLGIDLAPAGVTANGDPNKDYGANNGQNFPTISHVWQNDDGTTTVTGWLNAAPSSSYRIEFFSSSQGDPSGYGQGQNYLGADSVATDAYGNAPFTYIASQGTIITATATQILPGGGLGSTSEFCSYNLLDLVDTLSTTDPPINPNNDALMVSDFVTTTQLPTDGATTFDTTTTDPNNFRIEVYDPTGTPPAGAAAQVQVIRQGAPVGAPVTYSLTFQPTGAGNSHIYRSDVLRLVSNDVDHAACPDQTIEVQLGDVVQVTYQPMTGALMTEQITVGRFDAQKPTKQIRNVELNLISMQNNSGPNNVPTGTYSSPDQILAAVVRADQAWAQAGIRFVDAGGNLITAASVTDVHLTPQPVLANGRRLNLDRGLVIGGGRIPNTAKENALVAGVQDGDPLTVDCIFVGDLSALYPSAVPGHPPVPIPLNGHANTLYYENRPGGVPADANTLFIAKGFGLFTLAHEIGHILTNQAHWPQDVQGAVSPDPATGITTANDLMEGGPGNPLSVSDSVSASKRLTPDQISKAQGSGLCQPAPAPAAPQTPNFVMDADPLAVAGPAVPPEAGATPAGAAGGGESDALAAAVAVPTPPQPQEPAPSGQLDPLSVEQAMLEDWAA